jgi:hypothetical protein
MVRYRDSKGVLLKALNQVGWQASGFATKDEKIIRSKTWAPIRAFRFLCEEPDLSSSDLFQDVIERWMLVKLYVGPIIKPRPLEIFVLQGEPKLAHQVQRRIRPCAQTRDAPGVPGDFWLDQNDMHLDLFASSQRETRKRGYGT